MVDDFEHDRTHPIGYILVERGANGYNADWDGEVHPTIERAWKECRKANGEDWWDAVTAEGITHDTLRMADYLPYALFLTTPKPAHPKVPKKPKKKPVVAYPVQPGSVQRNEDAKTVKDIELQSISLGEPTVFGFGIEAEMEE